MVFLENILEIKVSFGEGRYKIDIFSVVTVDGISVTIIGGEKPHVGGTALSVPRKSLSGSNLSCDTWSCPVPGHKDTKVAIPVAELLCMETGKTVAVAAGIHIDNAREKEIVQLVDNCMEAAQLLVSQLKINNEK